MATRTRGKATEETGTDVMPAEEVAALAALDEAKRQLQIARDSENVEALSAMRDQAAAVQAYLTKRNEAREIAENAGELKVRAEAALGHLDRKAAPQGQPADKGDKGDGDQPAPLAEIRAETRAAWRKLGQLDDEQLDAVILQLRGDENESVGVNTQRAVRLARELIPTAPREPGEVTRDQFKEMAADMVSHMKTLDSEVSAIVKSAKRIVPRATDAELNRWGTRLGNTIDRLEALRDTMVGDETDEDEDETDTEGEEEPEEAEVVA